MNLSDAEKKAVVSAEAQLPDDFVFGLDIGTRSIVRSVIDSLTVILSLWHRPQCSMKQGQC